MNENTAMADAFFGIFGLRRMEMKSMINGIVVKVRPEWRDMPKMIRILYDEQRENKITIYPEKDDPLWDLEPSDRVKITIKKE